MKSPRTTLIAILLLAQQGAAIALAIVDGDPATSIEGAANVPVLIAAIGFFFARDQKQHETDKKLGQ